MSYFSPKQVAMLKNEIMKVRLDATNLEALENVPLDRLIENYVEMSVEVIKKMESIQDPIFLEVLEYTRAHFTREEFRAIQIEIYACCNKVSMKQRSLDKIAHLVMMHETGQDVGTPTE